MGKVSVLLEFAMSPIGKGESVSEYVARSLDIIDKSGIDYVLSPMGTTLEGDWHEVMDVVNQCFERMREDCPRISIRIDADYREGREDGLTKKIQSVEEKLGRDLKNINYP